MPLALSLPPPGSRMKNIVAHQTHAQRHYKERRHVNAAIALAALYACVADPLEYWALPLAFGGGVGRLRRGESWAEHRAGFSFVWTPPRKKNLHRRLCSDPILTHSPFYSLIRLFNLISTFDDFTHGRLARQIGGRGPRRARPRRLPRDRAGCQSQAIVQRRLEDSHHPS